MRNEIEFWDISYTANIDHSDWFFFARRRKREFVVTVFFMARMASRSLAEVVFQLGKDIGRRPRGNWFDVDVRERSRNGIDEIIGSRAGLTISSPNATSENISVSKKRWLVDRKKDDAALLLNAIFAINFFASAAWRNRPC